MQRLGPLMLGQWWKSGVLAPLWEVYLWGLLKKANLETSMSVVFWDNHGERESSIKVLLWDNHGKPLGMALKITHLWETHETYMFKTS